MTPRPPRFAERLMAWSLSEADLDAVLGDLSEEFASRAAARGTRRARRWYWRQTWLSLSPNIRRRLTDSVLAGRGPIGPTNTRRSYALEGLMTDLRHAIRELRTSPGFTIVALVVLTLGIGATTAIFSVVDAVVLRGLPFDEHDRLVALGERGMGGDKAKRAGPIGPPGLDPRDPQALSRVQPQNYLDWVAQQQVFESIAAIASGEGASPAPSPGPPTRVFQRVGVGGPKIS